MEQATLPLQPTEVTTIEVTPDEQVVLKHMRTELHNSLECWICRQDKWWYQRYADGRAEARQQALREVAEGMS